MSLFFRYVSLKNKYSSDSNALEVESFIRISIIENYISMLCPGISLQIIVICIIKNNLAGPTNTNPPLYCDGDINLILYDIWGVTR